MILPTITTVAVANGEDTDNAELSWRTVAFEGG